MAGVPTPGRMEDDGAAGPATGNDAAARPGPVRPARRQRLGLGVAEGRLLVHPHDLHARVHPGPGLLLHGQPDDRPRDPRLEPGQLLPRDEPVPAVPGAGRRRRAVAGVAGRGRPAGAADRRRGRPVRDDAPVRRRVRRDEGRRHDVRLEGLGRRQLRQVDRRARSSPRRARTPRRSTPAARSTSIGGVDAIRQADRHGLRPDARRDDRRARRAGRRPTTRSWI